MEEKELIKKTNAILDMKKVYIDVSSVKNKYFMECIIKKDVIACFSELSVLEIRNEKVYNGIPNEDFVNDLLEKSKILKINDKILNLAKFIVEQGIIHKRNYNDALHISIAKYYRCYTIMYDTGELKNKRIDFGRI